MKMPVNRHYYSLVTENVAGRGEGVYVLVFFLGGVDHPPDQTGGKSASSSLGGIDAPGKNQGKQLSMCLYLLMQLHHISTSKCILHFLLEK